jgi:hypothetical protein
MFAFSATIFKEAFTHKRYPVFKIEAWIPFTILWEHLHQRSVCDPANIFLTSKFLLTNFFPTPHIKLKMGLQVGGRLLITTH